MFDRVRLRIEATREVAERAAIAAAPRIEARLRDDSTTRRGNVPSFAKFGDIPSVGSASGNTIRVTCADWVMRKVRQLGQVDSWVEIAREAVADELAKGGK